MKEQFVTYEVALAIKELGFDENCIGYFGSNHSLILSPLDYNKNSLSYEDYPMDCKPISAPLWQQAIDWVREKYRYDIQITFPYNDSNKIEGINSVYYDIEIYHLSGGDAYKSFKFSQISNNYYYARKQAILIAIKLIKNKNK